MDDAPAIAMNFMRYKLFLYFSSLSKGVRTLWIPPGSATDTVRIYCLFIETYKNFYGTC